MAIRKICIVTGTRAEYGLLYLLMKELLVDVDIELQIIVTGMHLSSEFGLTYKTIENDGFFINEKIEMLLSSDTAVAITKSIGLGIIGFADALDRLQPDIMVVLGDRYEMLAAAQAAAVANIPIAHIHGGETTQGAFDEVIRHAITKMAQFHFVATEAYRKRVIQLGEQPETVFNVGAPGVDYILKLKYLTLKQLEQSIKFSLGEKFFLVTYHPVTRNPELSEKAMKNIFVALNKYKEYKILITKPNSDTGGRIITDLIDEYSEINSERVCVVASLGQLRYLSAMKQCMAVIGNSSSGIIEAPALKKATVNIGERQQGRLKATSIIDCDIDSESIIMAIDRAISDRFQQNLLCMTPIYGGGDASIKIKDLLKKVTLKNVLKKRFYNIDF